MTVNQTVQAKPQNIYKQEVHKTETQGERKVEQPQVSEMVPASGNTIEVKPTQHPVGCENYTNEIAKYNWNVQVAVNVMRAESGCNPTAIGDNYAINGLHAPSCGLYQIRTLPGRPSCEQLQDPQTNIAWAYKLYTASGWQPWSVCRHTVSCY
jgi:hypothetical protein